MQYALYRTILYNYNAMHLNDNVIENYKPGRNIVSSSNVTLNQFICAYTKMCDCDICIYIACVA